MIRPFGPVPLIVLRSMAFSAAIRAAIGETIKRPFDCEPPPLTGGADGAADVGCCTGVTATTGSGIGFSTFWPLPPGDAGGSGFAAVAAGACVATPLHK